MSSGGTCHYCKRYHCECVVSSNEPKPTSTPITEEGLQGLGFVSGPKQTSTPITEEGLQGLGFTGEKGDWFCPVQNSELSIWYWKARMGWCADFKDISLGMPQDIETVGRLLAVLRELKP